MECIFSQERWRSEEIAVSGLFQEKRAPEIFALVGHPDIGYGSILESGNRKLFGHYLVYEEVKLRKV